MLCARLIHIACDVPDEVFTPASKMDTCTRHAPIEILMLQSIRKIIAMVEVAILLAKRT